MVWQRDGYEVSDDPARLDLDLIHRFLSEDAYWSPGVERDVVERSIAGSVNFGVYSQAGQVGFARVVTDKSTFAWLADVFILEPERGHSLGKWLLEAILDHPDLRGLRRWILATHDAHGLYRRHGFAPADGQRFMVRE